MKNITELSQDLVWESVLEALSGNGALAKFYKVSRYDMNTLMKVYGKQVPKNLSHLFSLTQRNLGEERKAFIESLDQGMVFAMLLILGRSMKCWVESESMHGNFRTRWKVAHA